MNFFNEEIKNKLKNHTEQPPEDSWKFISKELNSKPFLVGGYRWAAAAAVAIMVFVGGWYLTKNQESNPDSPKIVQEADVMPETIQDNKVITNKVSEDTAKQPKNSTNSSIDLSEETSVEKLVQQKSNLNQETEVKIQQRLSPSMNEGEVHSNVFVHENTIENKDEKLNQPLVPRKDQRNKEIGRETKVEKKKTENWVATSKEKSSHIDSDTKIQPQKHKEVQVVKNENIQKDDQEREELVALNVPKQKVALDTPIMDLTAEDEVDEAEENNKTNKKLFAVSGYAGNWDVLKSKPNLVSPELEKYPTKAENSLEYGVLLTYAPTSRFKISGGVGVMNLEQNSSSIPIQLEYNLAANETDIIVAVPRGGFSQDAPKISELQYKAVSNIKSPKTGILKQQMRFIQIPVELSYDFISQETWNWSLVGGTSFIFLEQNDIQLNYLKKYKDVKYLSEVPNFSVGLKVGTRFNYQFSPQIGVYIQPEALQMINTFGEADSQITLGIKTGISIGL